MGGGGRLEVGCGLWVWELLIMIIKVYIVGGYIILKNSLVIIRRFIMVKY